MANISAIKLPDGVTYNVVDNTSGYITGMTILSYGSSTWNDFITAYEANKVVYCRASSNANPASGSQTRLAFMAYVDKAVSPTNVEFQYYRSVSSHSDSQQGDQMYVYKLTNAGTWTVTVRESYTKMIAGTGLSSSYSSGKLTLSLADAFGDTKNPYGTKDANYVLAGPTSGSAAVPAFRALVAADIPDLSATYLTSYTETDPTVPAWAKESSKPSYNFSEIGSTPTTISGYGITDAGISSGVITLGNDTITPLTSDSTLNAAKLSGAIPSGVTATTQSSTDNSTKIATTAYVTTAIANLPEPMLFKGSVGTSGTITSLPTAAAANEGFTYKVITALTTPVTAKVGDTVISNGSEWVVIPSGDEPSGTVTSVGLSNATDGGLTISDSPVTSSGSITVGHSNVLSSAQTTQAVYPIKIDKNGHISEYGTAVTIPTLKNVFGKVKVGSTTIEADTTQDTLELAAGNNITLTPDATNDKVTIASDDEVFFAEYGVTTPSELSVAIEAGKTVIAIYNNKYYYLVRPGFIGVSTSHIFTSVAVNSIYDSSTHSSHYETEVDTIICNGDWSEVGDNHWFNRSMSFDNDDETGVFIAEYGVTSAYQISKAIEAGKVVLAIYNDDYYYLVQPAFNSGGGNNRLYHLFTYVANNTIYTLQCNDNSGGAAYQWSNSSSSLQPLLVSGTNIKTINNTSLLGSGNISINQIFVAAYGTTTFADISSAIDAGKSVWVNNMGGYLPLVYDGRNRQDGHIFCGVIGDMSSTNMLGFGCCASNNNWSMRAFTPQEALTSGTNIKTVGGSSLLGSGNIAVGEANVQSDWSQSDSTADDYIKNKPTIPTVNNATLTIQKNGTTVNTFTANASSNVTANITMPEIFVSTSDPTSADGNNGDVWFKYSV